MFPKRGVWGANLPPSQDVARDDRVYRARARRVGPHKADLEGSVVPGRIQPRVQARRGRGNGRHPRSSARQARRRRKRARDERAGRDVGVQGEQRRVRRVPVHAQQPVINANPKTAKETSQKNTPLHKEIVREPPHARWTISRRRSKSSTRSNGQTITGVTSIVQLICISSHSKRTS